MGIDGPAAAAAAPTAASSAAAAPVNGVVDYQMLYQRGREVFESMQQKGGQHCSIWIVLLLSLSFI